MPFLAELILAILSPALTQQPPISVSVTSEARDQAARHFASAVVKELKRDSRFTLVEHGEASLVIALPAEVGWERRLEWTEIRFQARLNVGGGQSRIVAGHCWNWNLSACAKQVTDAAAEMSHH